ncbi:MAG: sensor histidine kinase [Fodinibius sp.]|nr:sensor histidine kinase [Fodinibius sp.]
MRQAVPCGLLLNELITNCYKHAFEGRDEGVISISIQSVEENIISLRVEDNGVGLPPDFDVDNQSSLGMTLVTTLVRQLGGEFSVSSDNGSSFGISFEIDR